MQGVPAPEVSVIVKYNGQDWVDVLGRPWTDKVRFSLPDKDVFAIDALANPPVAKPAGVFAGVGTVLFNMAVNPVTGKVYVSNTDAHNDVRFEGHNAFGPTQGGPAGSVRGHMAESRITAIDPATGEVSPRHLNKHIDFSKDGTPDEAAKSLAFPVDMAVTADGKTLFATRVEPDVPYVRTYDATPAIHASLFSPIGIMTSEYVLPSIGPVRPLSSTLIT